MATASGTAVNTITSPKMTAPSLVSTRLRAMSSPTASVAPASVALAADTRYGPAVVASNVAPPGRLARAPGYSGRRTGR